MLSFQYLRIVELDRYLDSMHIYNPWRKQLLNFREILIKCWSTYEELRLNSLVSLLVYDTSQSDRDVNWRPLV